MKLFDMIKKVLSKVTSEKKRKRKIIAWTIVAIILFFLALQFKNPSNDRIWELGQDQLPYISISGNDIVVKNLRDFRWGKTAEETEASYLVKHYRLNELNSVDVVISHFASIEGVAHIFLTFGFEDGEHIVVSVETRRESDEHFSTWQGIMRKFEIIYVVGTEQDLIGTRTNVRGERVYLYPTIANPEKSQALFKLVAEDVNSLYRNPDFYNTLVNNCSNVITRRVEEISYFDFPTFNYKAIFPGYFDEILFKMGVFPPTDLSFEEYKAINLIKNDEVDHTSENFSQQIREHFLVNEEIKN
jgi:hypothetical protein